MDSRGGGILTPDEISALISDHVESQGDRFMLPGEVASLFRVDPKTVTRWAQDGRLKSIRTPGGHRRFRESDVRAYLNKRAEENQD